MPFTYETIDCQNPPNDANVRRIYRVVKAVFNNTAENAKDIRNKAWQLAMQVNPHKANNATDTRTKERLILDAMGGVLSELAWHDYINRVFGQDTVSFTPFNTATAQIDLLLKNGKTIEVRSSFPRNGIKFAICNERYNFKNICKYENLYKPSETDKDFFACVLFETQKKDLMQVSNIILYLIGGSTKAMMQDDTIAFESDLIAEDDIAQKRTRYRVIRLKDALDMTGFIQYMKNMGYNEKTKSRQ